MDNLLSAEALITARLISQVPELLDSVFSAADLEGVTSAGQKTPAAHVFYFGDRIVEGPGGRSSQGDMQCVDQVWYVVLAVRNVKTQATGVDARLEAGVLMKKVLKALQGFQLSPEHSPLKRVAGAPPGFKAGFLYLPLCFITRIFV